jgi:hypothetical protein
MSGAAGTDADTDSVAVWKEKVFADPSQKNNCGNLCPPEDEKCRSIPGDEFTQNIFPVSPCKPTRKPTRRNDDATNPIRKLNCSKSQAGLYGSE